MRLLGRYLVLIYLLCWSCAAFSAVQCAAFSTSGVFAASQIDGMRLTLNLTNPSGTSPVPTLQVSEARACKVSFSQDDQYIAVALTKAKPMPNGVEVAILNVATRTWIGGRPFVPDFAELAGGFVGTTHQVATVFLSGEWQRGASIGLQLFTVDPSSGTHQAALRPMQAPSTSVFDNSMDSSHNRIWYRNPDGKCGLRSVTMLGEDTASPEIPSGLIPGCFEPIVIDFPNADHAIVGSQTGGEIQLWRVNLTDKSVQELKIPVAKTQEIRLLNLSAHTADGKLVCVGLRVLRRDRFGGLRDAGYALAILGTDPWKLLATVDVPSLPKTLSSLAVDYRAGQAIIEAYDGARWIRLEKNVMADATTAAN